MTAALALLFLGSVGLIVGIALRNKAYGKFFRYRRDQDQRYDFSNSAAVTVEIRLDADGFTWPATEGTWDTAFLEIRIRSNWLGRLAEPYLEARTLHHYARQYFERGAAGQRLVNISGLCRGGVAPGQRFWLHATRLDFDPQATRLILFRTALPARPRTLILAPHPDDAEIAAFGFYSQAESTVVTVTAGEGGGFYLAHAQPGEELVTGRLRVWDSIHVPTLGDVPIERAINLGYADGSLLHMHDRTTHLGGSAEALRNFRMANNSSMLRENAEPTWASLVRDLVEILRRTNPEIIVTPHPLLDDHPDHAFTTLALFEALRGAGLGDGKLLLYTNHPPTTNLHPVGENDGVVSLPPRFGEPLDFRTIHSHPLSETTQRTKFHALEAMHDLRTLPRLEARRWRDWLRATLAGLRNQITGVDARATSYFRRAVRGNELFFVSEFSDAELLANRLRVAMKDITWHTFE
ncbi:MAG: GlcNAc-PI de-N-acetylase [Chthoniobacter sp.]|nr:GlcNAc-PI de-N-acetylase [Chthoniobacter sp.]